jgi:hypothetical protein
VIHPGANAVEFNSDPPEDAALQARVTLTTAREALGETARVRDSG